LSSTFSFRLSLKDEFEVSLQGFHFFTDSASVTPSIVSAAGAKRDDKKNQSTNQDYPYSE